MINSRERYSFLKIPIDKPTGESKMKDRPLNNLILEFTDFGKSKETDKEIKVSIDFEIDSPEFYIVGLWINEKEETLSEIKNPFHYKVYRYIGEKVSEKRKEILQGEFDSAMDKKNEI